MLVAVTLALAACGGSGSGRHMLDGTAWRLTAWTTSSLNPDAFTITAKFAHGTISGSSGVNAYGGPYTATSDEAFSVGELAVTAMGGTGPDMRAEQKYLTLLGQARSFTRSGGTLTLLNGQGHTSLILKASTP